MIAILLVCLAVVTAIWRLNLSPDIALLIGAASVILFGVGPQLVEGLFFTGLLLVIVLVGVLILAGIILGS